jgi:hypothetical protein
MFSPKIVENRDHNLDPGSQDQQNQLALRSRLRLRMKFHTKLVILTTQFKLVADLRKHRRKFFFFNPPNPSQRGV